VYAGSDSDHGVVRRVVLSRCLVSLWRLLRTFLGVLMLVSAFGAIGFREPASATGPVNFGRIVFNVTDFNADPTGATSSLTAVMQALAACTGAQGVLNNTAGCEVHFPAGTYSLAPAGGNSLPILLPQNIPITISGDGQGASLLQITGTATDVIQGAGLAGGAANSDGFTLHDIGFTHLAGASPCGGICADVNIPHGHKVSIYNVSFASPSTAIELGITTGIHDRTGETNITAITSRNTTRCFLQLNGENGTTHVTGVTADGGHNVGSQVLCMPTTNVATSGAQYGLATFRLSDSTFTAFGRGISITAYSLYFKNNYIDNVAIDSAEDGPAVEFFAAPSPSPVVGVIFPPAVIQDVRISNSRLVSAATACVLHGNIQGVKFVNDVCIGGQPAAVPASCLTSPSQRGYVLVEISGTAGPSASITLNVTFRGSTTIVAYGPSSGFSAQRMASGLGQAINMSSAVTNSCPALIPVQTFHDYFGSSSVTDFSIGVDLELFTYQWGGTAPTFTATSSGGPIISLVNVSSTPMPPDAMYLGVPPTIAGLPPPSDVTVEQGASFGALNGAGLHLQGSMSTLITRNKFGNGTLPNAYGAEVETAGVTYSDTQVQANDLTGSVTGSLLFLPTLTTLTGLTLSTNLGYDPVGLETVPSTICGATVTNPFPTAQQIYIQGAFSGIKKNGTTMSPPTLGAGSSAIVALGVGQTIEIDCGSPPQVRWYGV
jgi:hypothetical protein